MAIVAALLPLSLLLATAAVVAFRWAARDGQFDDLDRTAATPLLADLDERPVQPHPRNPLDPGFRVTASPQELE